MPQLMKIDDALSLGRKELEDVAERPLLEAEILLSHALGKERVYLHAHSKDKVDVSHYLTFLRRRKEHEPIEYITQKVSFYGMEFFITSGVLIPRPETEILIDEVAKELTGTEKVAEIGVGSGVISAILKRKFPALSISATDISAEAISCAATNFRNLGLDIELFHTSMLDNVTKEFDVIVSNPPYIAKDFPLEKNVAMYEPHEALFGGEEGEEILLSIIDLFLQKSTKIVACEMGFDQKVKIESYLKRKEFRGSVRFYKDLAGLDRGFILKKDD